MEWTRCPECAALAVVTARTVVERAAHRSVHTTIRCVQGHWLSRLGEAVPGSSPEAWSPRSAEVLAFSGETT